MGHNAQISGISAYERAANDKLQAKAVWRPNLRSYDISNSLHVYEFKITDHSLQQTNTHKKKKYQREFNIMLKGINCCS